MQISFTNLLTPFDGVSGWLSICEYDAIYPGPETFFEQGFLMLERSGGSPHPSEGGEG